MKAIAIGNKFINNDAVFTVARLGENETVILELNGKKFVGKIVEEKDSLYFLSYAYCDQCVIMMTTHKHCGTICDAVSKYPIKPQEEAK